MKNKCDNLEANVKRLKDEATVLRNQNKKLGKERLQKLKVIPSKAQVEAIPIPPPIQNSFLNNNGVPIKLCDDTTPMVTPNPCAGQSCQPPADPSSTALTPPRPPCTPPHQATPVSPNPPPGFPINNTSIDLKEKEAAVTIPESMVTMQDKLKEVIEKGQKLDFTSVLSLIKTHPWEESKEMVENDDEYYYGDFENDDYEGYLSEEINLKLEEI